MHSSAEWVCVSHWKPETGGLVVEGTIHQTSRKPPRDELRQQTVGGVRNHFSVTLVAKKNMKLRLETVFGVLVVET